MANQEIYSVFAVVTEDKNGSLVGIGLDHQSGGYPYWASTWQSWQLHETAEKARGAATSKYIPANAYYPNAIRVIKLDLTMTTIMDFTNPASIKTQKINDALSKLTAEERELLGLKQN